jgi:hypothetical protein
MCESAETIRSSASTDWAVRAAAAVLIRFALAFLFIDYFLFHLTWFVQLT